MRISFGTGGFRGDIGSEFNEQNVRLIAQGVANYAKKQHFTKPIYVSYDLRLFSPEAAIWISEVLAGNGFSVCLSNGPTTTPALMYAVKRSGAELGFMVTSSHNPANNNGVKLVTEEGRDAAKEVTDQIEKEIQAIQKLHMVSLEEGKSSHLIQSISFLDDYCDYVASFIHLDSPASFRILLDPIYGTGMLTLRKTYQKIGIQNIHEIHSVHDTNFGGLQPNPIPQNMEADARLVLNEGYDIAIGTDSDCDRLAILDEKGQYVDANEIMAALYFYLIHYRGEKGDIVKNVTTSLLIDRVADKLGYHCHTVDVGFKNITQGMKDYDALLGGESSGGLTIRGYLYGKDSTFSSALFLEMMTNLHQPVSKIVQEIKDFANYHMAFYDEEGPCYHHDAVAVALQKDKPVFSKAILREEFIGANVRYLFSDGSWALARFSGTQPLLRYYAESEDPAFAKECIRVMEEFVNRFDR